MDDRRDAIRQCDLIFPGFESQNRLSAQWICLLSRRMQVIVKMHGKTVEEYVEQMAHRSVRAPEACPRCGRLHVLTHLDYYQRGCTDSRGKVLEINIKRFECTHCGLTVSSLPDFAQPYRLINNHTTQKFFNGDTVSEDVQRNYINLRRYWRQFLKWAGRLKTIIGVTLGRAPPKEPAAGLWRRILAGHHSLARATLMLVQDFRVTCFGQYRCHQPALQAT